MKKKKSIFLLLAFVVAVGIILSSFTIKSKVKLRVENKNYTAVLFGSIGSHYAKSLFIFDGLRITTTRRIKAFKPWKLMAGDVDGDGNEELSIIVYKTTNYHPVMANRPFFYSFDGNKLTPKWRGSRLYRPFEDYILVYEGDRANLIALELLEDGKKVLGKYSWNYFGFNRIAESKVYYEDVRFMGTDFVKTIDGKDIRIEPKFMDISGGAK